MKDRTFLAIDAGLTSTKAVLFEMDGEEIASVLEKTAVNSCGDVSELDMTDQWNNVVRAIRGVLECTGLPAEAIHGVGVTGHGAGTYLVDPSGVPVRQAITSMDNRAAQLMADWDKRGVTAYEKTRHNVWAGQPIPQLAWLKQAEKDRYQRIRWVFSAKNWITYQLTGEPCAELTDASNSGLINLQTRAYDPLILETFGIAEIEQTLPPLKPSTGIIGRITPQAAGATGLSAGTPVSAGLFDVISCALGSGVYDHHYYSIIAGTWNINTAIEHQLIEAASTTKCSLGADGRSYAYVESSATSAGNLEWLVSHVIESLAKPQTRDELFSTINREVAKKQTTLQSPLFFPFLYASHLAENLGARFLGLRPEHDLWDMVRAVYEGVVFAHRQHLDILQESSLTRDTALLTGGATNSEVWCQMFADITGLSIQMVDHTQAGALGAVLTTALGTGVYSTFPEAVRQMVHQGQTFHPCGNEQEKFHQRYQDFLKFR